MNALLPPAAEDPLWYKDAVVYQLHVKSFFDGNDDGVGDFPGLIGKLDYIASLGVTAIWLLPFYPSPRRDDGYDIADYRGVHADYGSVADVRKLIRAAHARGLRVITELVVNHTSDQHPWFQRARRAPPGSAARRYYVWADSDRGYPGTRIIFCDTETSNWTWDPLAGAYYWHRFYSHQPDLNYDNPQVLREILAAMRHWLDMGVDGLRLDAVPYLIEREGTSNENLPETHAVLKRLRAVVDAEYPGRVLLAEANQWPEDAQEYFGAGDECHMSFHFPLMPRMYMAIAQEDRFPITDIIRQTPDIPPACQWAIFLRNHDELTLEMVTSRERDYLWNVYAADPRARINLGIRRRLAPLLERDRRRIELMNSLLLSMPGTPVLYYGDEIGMGDNIHLGDRDGVRTPMQWSPDRNGGFSRADPERLPLPVLMGPLYGYEAVNVEAQQRDPHSLLNWTRRLLAKRRQTHAFGRGALRFLLPGNRKVLAYLREWEDSVVLCVANLSSSAQPVELPLQAHAGKAPLEMLGGAAFPTIGELPYLLTLPPYGFYWFDLSAGAIPPAWHTDAPAQMADLATLVLRGGTGLPLASQSRQALEQEVAPAYLARQRWHPERASDRPVRLDDALPFRDGQYCWTMFSDPDAGARRLVPVALLWEEDPQPRYPIARVRRGAQVGVMADAFLEPGFIRAVVGALRSNETLRDPAGAELRFQGTPALAALEWPDDLALQWLETEQSNSSVIIGDQAILKLLRNPVPGISAEADMAARLSALGYAHTPALLGSVTRVEPDGRLSAWALLHRYVPNEGDAWEWTLAYLKRTLSSALASGAAPDDFEADLKGYGAYASTIGRRLAELHNLLWLPSDDPEFAPRRANAVDAQRSGEAAVTWLRAALQALRDQADRLEAPSRASALWLIEHGSRIERRLEALAQAQAGAPLLRGHGDFHLGQVLVAGVDAYLIDFEGEPMATPQARRALISPAKDLAGLLRSLDYAAAAVSRADPLAPASPDANAGPPVALGSEPEAALREVLLARFRAYASDAFLAGYRTARDAGLDLDAATEQALLDLAQMEKAAYEICYELAHRPDWVSLPLRALAEQARASLMASAVDRDGESG